MMLIVTLYTINMNPKGLHNIIIVQILRILWYKNYVRSTNQVISGCFVLTQACVHWFVSVKV